MGVIRVGKYIIYINRLIDFLIGELESLGNKLFLREDLFYLGLLILEIVVVGVLESVVVLLYYSYCFLCFE